MENSLSWESYSSSAYKEIPLILSKKRFITAFTTARDLSLS